MGITGASVAASFLKKTLASHESSKSKSLTQKDDRQTKAFARLKKTGFRISPSQNPTPGDGNCLFWALSGLASLYNFVLRCEIVVLIKKVIMIIKYKLTKNMFGLQI